MNQYISFIIRVLWTCFFVALLGIVVQVLVGWQQYMIGWAWGIFVMTLYILLLALHNYNLTKGNAGKAVAKARRNAMWRLAFVGAFTVLGLQIPGVEAISLFIAIAVMQPILYIVYWLLGRR